LVEEAPLEGRYSWRPIDMKHPRFGEFNETPLMLHGDPGSVMGAVLRVEGRNSVEHHLREGVCHVGSSVENDLVIDDRSVSRKHAVFSLAPEGVLVEDLGSTNGTFFLGNRIGKMVLGLGTRVELGSVRVSIEPDAEALFGELEFHGDDGYRGMLGTSPRIRKLFALLQRLERTEATILIEGESGVGKEEVARVLHEASPVSAKDVVTVNCGAIAKELVASELFGHRRGAFTGAISTRSGAFERADGATLFLDEVGELPLEVQPTLLRALETGEIRPVGADETRRVRVRVIAATNRDLESDVAAGRFREDLFYRLAVVRVHVPPLRGRPEDVELLARHFAAKMGGGDLPRHVIEELKSRSWPGNVRELRNAVQSFAAVGQLPAPARAAVQAPEGGLDELIDETEPYAIQKDRVVEEFTKAYLRAVLRYTNGNQAAAARVGKLDRTHFGRLMSKYGLSVRKTP
jgi:transcriptional regulator with GAF, ATPase, and Fis domain